jgi:deaminated glutathione amidase
MANSFHLSPASEVLKVAVCQMTSVNDVETNLKTILQQLRSLESDLPDLVCFPENALYLRVREGDKIQGVTVETPAVQQISGWVKRTGCVVHLGSVPLSSGTQLFNSSLLLTADGAVRDSYRKVHLFDVDVEGHKPVRESDVFAHGDAHEVIEVKGFKLGSSICYDMRFPELYLRYATAGVDAILIPSAFLVPTGKAHWDVLTRARAIEAQAYVLAAAQGGEHAGVDGGTRHTYGHSIIVDPWGVVIAERSEDGPGIIRAELSKDRIASVRKQIPMKNHRRLV